MREISIQIHLEDEITAWIDDRNRDMKSSP